MRWAVVLLVACAPRAPARTLGAGHAEVAASLGGPLFANLGPAIPMPMIEVGGRYGVGDDVDVIANANVTAAAYGVAGIDVGATYQLLRHDDVAFAATGRANVLTDGHAARVYPEVALVGDYRVSPSWTLIYGATVLAQFSPPRDKPPAFVAFVVGGELALGMSTLVLDVSWISPWQDSTSVIAWQPGAGAIAIRLGYRRGVR